MTWNEAEKEAVEAGGHLVTLRSFKEEDWIRDTFQRNEYFWIGFKRNEDLSWSWVSGEEVVYKNWDRGQPDNWLGKENAGVMNYLYLNSAIFGDYWNDTDGSGIFRGVAEIIP